MNYFINRFNSDINLKILNDLGLKYISNVMEINKDREKIYSLELLNGEIVCVEETESSTMTIFFDTHKTGFKNLHDYFSEHTVGFFN